MEKNVRSKSVIFMKLWPRKAFGGVSFLTAKHTKIHTPTPTHTRIYQKQHTRFVTFVSDTTLYDAMQRDSIRRNVNYNLKGELKKWISHLKPIPFKSNKPTHLFIAIRRNNLCVCHKPQTVAMDFIEYIHAIERAKHKKTNNPTEWRPLM